MEGVITALITPFTKEQNLDEDGLRENIQFQIAHRVDGILVLGTTGESPTLSFSEKKRVIEIAREEIQGRVHFMVGTGTNATSSTIQLTQLAKEMQADSALIVTPYYNCPTQEGIFRHFESIQNAVDIPLIIYSIQKRTGVNVTIETLKRLSTLKNVAAVKESSGNFVQMMETIENVPLPLFSGDDILTLPCISMGGAGIISVLSNVFPDLVLKLTRLAKHDLSKARELHYFLSPLIRSLFIETNPIPIKELMNHLGLSAGPCRLPLSPLLDENKQKLFASLENLKTAKLSASSI